MVKKKIMYKPLKLALEDRLKDKLPYNIYLSDVINIVDYINNFYRYNIKNEGIDGIELYINYHRRSFPRRDNEVGKKFWLFSKVIRLLNDENILYKVKNHYNGDPKTSRSRVYDYTNEFIESLSNYFSGITFEDIKIKNNVIGKQQLDTQLMIDNHKVLTTKLQLSENTIQKMIEELYEKYEDEKKVIFSISKLNNILNKEFLTLVRGESSGRIYHSYNMLNSIFRKYFKINDEPLVEIDLKSTQPLLFANYLMRKYYLDNKNEPDLLKEIRSFFGKVVDNDIYEFMADKYEELNGTKIVTKITNKDKIEEIDISDRDNAKQELFTFLFKKDNRGLSTYNCVFKNYFPNLYNYIKELRREFNSFDENLAIELQKEEVNIFINGTQHLVKYGILTIHDAVVCPESMKNTVLNTLKNVLQKRNIRGWTLVEENLCYNKENYRKEHKDDFSISYEEPEEIKIENYE